jgi:hypothetical protein
VALPTDPEARFAMLIATDAEFRDAWNELLADPAFQRSYDAIGGGRPGHASRRVDAGVGERPRPDRTGGEGERRGLSGAGRIGDALTSAAPLVPRDHRCGGARAGRVWW